jgi:hypothetical protein
MMRNRSITLHWLLVLNFQNGHNTPMCCILSNCQTKWALLFGLTYLGGSLAKSLPLSEFVPHFPVFGWALDRLREGTQKIGRPL